MSVIVSWVGLDLTHNYTDYVIPRVRSLDFGRLYKINLIRPTLETRL